MADLPRPGSLSFEQLQKISQSPDFYSLDWSYRQQVLTELRNKQSSRVSYEGMATDALRRQEESEAAAERKRQQAQFARNRMLEQFGSQPSEALAKAPSPTPSMEDLTSEAVRSVFPRPQIPTTTKTDTPETPVTTAAPSGAAAQPDPFAEMRATIMGMGGGGGPRPKIAGSDTSQVLKDIPQVGERQAGETYKADPYMTMLQTGLKILAAKPEIGQSALSTIAAPLASGVEQYRGEKQKEAESRKAEAEAARTDRYRQAEAARSTAGLAAQLRQQDLTASIAEAQLTQSAEQHGQSVSLQKMDLLRKIEDDRFTNTIRQAFTPEARMKLMDAESTELEKVERRLQDPKLSAGERQILENVKARKERNLSYLQGTARTEMQSDTSRELAARRALTQIDLQIAKLGSGIPTPETTKALADLRNKRREIALTLGEGEGGKSILPPPP
jgi:hypothetical protein